MHGLFTGVRSHVAQATPPTTTKVEAPILKLDLFPQSIKATKVASMQTKKIRMSCMNLIYSTIGIYLDNCYWWTYIN